MNALTTTCLTQVGAAMNRTWVLPLLMLSITERCNSACVSCGWWRTPGAAASGELTLDEIDAVAGAAASMGTRLVVFTGGEPLVRADACDAASRFTRRGIRAHLLTSGLALASRAEAVGRVFERVIVSLDGADAASYRDIRGVDGLRTVTRGVAALRAVAPHVRVTARATVHRRNFRDLSALVTTARAIGCAGLSVLAADLDGAAFGQRDTLTRDALRLSPTEVAEFDQVVETFITRHDGDITSGFVAESPAKLRRLVRHYAAANGGAAPAPPRCNAPWVSAVVGATGEVRPCFFHAPVGDVRHAALGTIARTSLPAFRQTLDVSSDPVCARCVCALKTGWRGQPWA